MNRMSIWAGWPTHTNLWIRRWQDREWVYYTKRTPRATGLPDGPIYPCRTTVLSDSVSRKEKRNP